MSTYKPILFSGSMVRANLDNRKRMTRRVIKPQPFVVDGDNVYDSMGRLIPPRFFPGDILWVRETFNLANSECSPENYRATRTIHPPLLGWSPAIHMPKLACRLFLRVTAVRVERVQDISEEDARAEGFVSEHTGIEVDFGDAIARAWFRKLWDLLNAKRGFGWDANPWVWVYEFERTERPEGWPNL